jgi:dienelactone hydrolase
MLHFVSARLSISYLLLCVLSCIGVLQIQAARHGLIGLSLWGGRGSRRQGCAIGSVLITGSFASFYALTPGIFVPGPAGSELVVLFGSGLILALASTLTAAALTAPRLAEGMMDAEGTQAVATSRLQGQLRVPAGPGPHPALCLVPELGGSAKDAEIVAALLQARGFVTLTIDWTAAGAPGEVPRYPDVLALVPAAMDYLLQQPEVDGERIGVLGFGLGGDLVLRAAGADEQIAAAVAVCPLLTSRSPDAGIDLLRHGSLHQAIRWERRRRAQGTLAEQLHALDFSSRIAPRPLLILDVIGGLSAGALPKAEGRPLPWPEEEERWSQMVARVVARWHEEHL